jgi:endonuclease III
VADLYSKVTLRPRSKLERLLEVLEPDCEVPRRPKNGIVTQLALFYLLSGQATPASAADALKSLSAGGSLDVDKLASLPRSFVEGVCPADRVEEVHAALRCLGKAAREGIERAARVELEEARRQLSYLPRLSTEQIDLVLLAAGLHSVVAPSLPALRVAVRLGYPGSSYAAIARALDAEVPEGDNAEVAWRAHHVLRQHGKRICLEQAPACGRCRVRMSCSFRGEGDDPAARLPALGVRVASSDPPG